MKASSSSLNRQHLETQLLRQPLPQIGNDDSGTRKHLQDWILESLKGECDSGPRHRNATQRTNLPHSKPDVAMPQPDLRYLETDSSRDTFPDNCHLGRKRITLAPEGKSPEFLPLREKLVEKSLQAIEIERQVQPVPAGKRGRQKIVHDRKYR